MPEFLPNIIDHILVFVIGILLPLRSMKAQKMLKKMHFSPVMKSRLYIGNSISLWVMALLLAGANWLMGRHPIEFGLSWPPEKMNDYALWSLLGFILLYGADLLYETAFPKSRKKTVKDWQENIPFLPASFSEFTKFIPLAITAGVCEEFIFRGYFISYFYNLLGKDHVYLAIFIPTLIFALVHQYQGRKAMVKIFFMAVFFGLIYYYTGSLWQVMLIHFLVDLIGGFAAWRLLKDIPLTEAMPQEISLTDPELSADETTLTADPQDPEQED
jgi:membrane protease YdiL (CAAX protease family)